MTSQTKKFIDPSDILGLRLQCQHPECQATVLLPLDKPMNTPRLASCPLCLRSWLTGSSSSLVLSVEGVIDHIRDLKAQMGSGHLACFSHAGSQERR
jgi:hypothetical protein